jgi:hypothetical protein
MGSVGSAVVSSSWPEVAVGLVLIPNQAGMMKAHNLRNKTRNSCGLLQEMIDFTLPVRSRKSAGHLVGPLLGVSLGAVCISQVEYIDQRYIGPIADLIPGPSALADEAISF